MTTAETDNVGVANAHGDRAVAAADPLAQPFVGRSLLGLVLISLLGAALRLFHLGDWSIWIDEAHTWRDITLPFGSFLKSERAWYPLSFLGLRALADSVLPSLSEFWMRLPFALCGIVSVPLLAIVGKPLIGRRAALVAALFLAINPWHIYFSQNARGYVMVAFFALLAAGTYWHGIQRSSRALRVFGLFLALCTGACHLTGLALLPTFLAYPVLDYLQKAGRQTWGYLAVLGIGGCLIPLVADLFPPFLVFRHAKPDASLAHLLHTTAFYFRPPLLCAALAGVWLMVRVRLQGPGLFLMCWLVVPLFVVGVLGSTFVKVTARYAFCALPALMMLAAIASVRFGELLVAGLSHRSWRSRLVPSLVFPAILGLDMAAYDYLYFTTQYGDRGRWREAAEIVQGLTPGQEYDVYTINEPSLQYYLRPNHFRGFAGDPHPGVRVWLIEGWEIGKGFPWFMQPKPGVLPPGATPTGGVDSYFAAIESDCRHLQRNLYFVVTLPELAEKDPDGRLLARIRNECRLVQVLPCWVGPKDETIYVYEWSKV